MHKYRTFQTYRKSGQAIANNIDVPDWFTAYSWREKNLQALANKCNGGKNLRATFRKTGQIDKMNLKKKVEEKKEPRVESREGGWGYKGAWTADRTRLKRVTTVAALYTPVRARTVCCWWELASRLSRFTRPMRSYILCISELPELSQLPIRSSFYCLL